MLQYRLAIRALCAAPLVSAVAIVSLMFGIGANTAVFSIVNAVLLRPLPYPHPDGLVLLGYTFSGASVPLVSETKLNVWKEHAGGWEDVAALRSRQVILVDGVQAEQVLAVQTNADYFTLFGAHAARGRTFTAAEDRPGGDRVALLSDGFRKRRFGSAMRLSSRRHVLQLASAGRSGPTRPERRVRAVLVAGELALALVLLVGATGDLSTGRSRMHTLVRQSD